MIIKPNKRIPIICMGMVGVFLFVEFCLLVITKEMDYAFIFFFMFGPLILSYSVSLCRTFVLDKEGCTIKLGCFQKKHLWCNLKYMIYRNYENCIPRQELMQYGIEFSFKLKKRKKGIKPSWYSFMFAPYSLCYFYFPFSTKGTQFKDYKSYAIVRPVYYLCDDKEFFSKINEWGIVFEEEQRDEKIKNKYGFMSMIEECTLITVYCVVRFSLAIVIALGILSLL